MKLKARFPQIGIALPESVATAARNSLRRAFGSARNTTGSAALEQAASRPAAVGAEESPTPSKAAQKAQAAQAPPARLASRATDWASTMAVWRHTSGKGDGQP